MNNLSLNPVNKLTLTETVYGSSAPAQKPFCSLKPSQIRCFLQQGACMEAEIPMASGFSAPDSRWLGLQKHLANWKHEVQELKWNSDCLNPGSSAFVLPFFRYAVEK